MDEEQFKMLEQKLKNTEIKLDSVTRENSRLSLENTNLKPYKELYESLLDRVMDKL